MPLQVIVIGAGIAGLCAATSLRQSGHSVQIFEKSAFAAETGAALLLAPNGAQVLSKLGFSFEGARACRMRLWETCDGATLERLSCVSFEDAQERFGSPVWAIHRVDLHNELLRLALEGERAAKLHLSSPVGKIDPTSGTIELENGAIHQADLVVAADGLHSVMRIVATEKKHSAPAHSGLSAFRFLLPTQLIKNDPELGRLLAQKPKGASIFVDTGDLTNERHMVWYDCQRSGDVQNFVGIHPSRPEAEDREKGGRFAMMEEFSNFHPGLSKLISLAEDVKCWPLFAHDPLSNWVFGKVVLIGDAAHPMLPFGGQGSNQAIEDGGALGYLVDRSCDQSSLPERLDMFQKIRRNRASRVQILSQVRVGREKEVEDRVKHYAGEISTVPTSFSQRIDHDYGFDVLDECTEILATTQLRGYMGVHGSAFSKVAEVLLKYLAILKEKVLVICDLALPRKRD